MPSILYSLAQTPHLLLFYHNQNPALTVWTRRCLFRSIHFILSAFGEVYASYDLSHIFGLSFLASSISPTDSIDSGTCYWDVFSCGDTIWTLIPSDSDLSSTSRISSLSTSANTSYNVIQCINFKCIHSLRFFSNIASPAEMLYFLLKLCQLGLLDYSFHLN